MIVRAGDDELVGLDVLVEHELPGIRALDPQILRRLAAQDVADFWPDDIGEPIHGSLRNAVKRIDWNMATRAKPNKPRSLGLGIISSENRSPLFRIMPPPIPRNYGLFCGLFGAPDALRQRRHQIGDSADGFGGGAAFGIEAAMQGINQRGADHGAIGLLGNRARRFRRANAKTDTDRQLGMPFDAC